MALVDIDDDLKALVQAYVEKNSIDYPSMKNFVDRAIKYRLEKLAREEEKAEEKK